MTSQTVHSKPDKNCKYPVHFYCIFSIHSTPKFTISQFQVKLLMQRKEGEELSTERFCNKAKY